ncbi:MAG: hypothetical protein PWP27_1431 [Clostridiales bacterium]|jgi:uncharacterized protein YaaQ|nr:hypothetical protein [Clostridiales bacterium]MDK2933621.1 hypothetical protein [Clostridiales bacterium]
MKLVLAIVHDEDGNRVLGELNKKGFSVTKLATTGGFLRAGNTTLLVGTSKEHVQTVIDIIKAKCSSRKQIATSPTPSTGAAGLYVPYPVEVEVGGATIFVVDVEKFEKV